MKIKVEKINLVKNEKSTIKAFCNINIDDNIKINDIKLLTKKDGGYYYKMPQISYVDEKKGVTQYKDFIYVSKETYKLIVDSLELAFKDKIKSEFEKLKSMTKDISSNEKIEDNNLENEENDTDEEYEMEM